MYCCVNLVLKQGIKPVYIDFVDRVMRDRRSPNVELTAVPSIRPAVRAPTPANMDRDARIITQLRLSNAFHVCLTASRVHV